MSPLGLTMRQAGCLAFVRGYIAANGYSPSYADIKAALGLASNSGVHRLVHGLRKRGHLALLPHYARSIVVTVEA